MLHACERWGVDAATITFRAKFDRKQRAGKSPDILRVLRGRIEFVGSVRGRDDALYLGLLDRYLNLDKKAHTKGVIVGTSADQAVLSRALWVLQDDEPPYMQGTAFAAEHLGLLTAAHAVRPKTKAYSPAAGIPAVPVQVVTSHDDVDVARLSPGARIPVALKLGSSAALKIGDHVKVLGFPKYHVGATVNVQEGRITAYSPWHGVPHFIVDCSIVKGNSGGAVLNEDNQVVGIAVKGQGSPKKFNDDDEMSRFVPIDYALKYLI
jgi:S1-C subfamily serine protease